MSVNFLLLNIVFLLYFLIALVFDQISARIEQTYLSPNALNLTMDYTKLDKLVDSSCFCQNTLEHCDSYCCCSKKCGFYYNGSFAWGVFNQCLPNPKVDRQVELSACIEPTFQTSIDNLNSPLRVWSQNLKLGFCVAYDNSGISLIKQVNSSATAKEFSDQLYKILRKNYTNENTLFRDFSTSKGIPYELNKYVGVNFTTYKVNDPILTIDGSNSVSSLKALPLPLTGPMGTCKSDFDFVRFMDEKTDGCTVKTTLTQDICLNYNKENFIVPGAMKNIYLGPSLTPISPKITYRSNQENYYYKVEPSFAGVASYSASSCTCNNMITSAVYDFKLNKTTIIGLDITYNLESFSGCTRSLNIPYDYKVSFSSFNTTFDYPRSGNPGYIKGKSLIFGIKNQYIVQNNVSGQNDTSDYIDQFIEPTTITGISKSANSYGKCLFSTNSFGMPVTPVAPTSDYGFYNSIRNPTIMNFQEKIVYSCYDEFDSVDSLQKYCEGQGWNKKQLFFNLNNITHISMFGNPNNHFIQDWVTLNTFQLTTSNSIWDTVKQKCLIPSVFNINIMYATYGSTNNTQNAIIRIERKIESLNIYGKGLSSSNKRRYYSYLNINFYRIPQTTNYWFAPGPGLIKLPQNIMYPFKIGTTNYGHSSILSLSIFCLLLMITFLV